MKKREMESKERERDGKKESMSERKEGIGTKMEREERKGESGACQVLRQTSATKAAQ